MGFKRSNIVVLLISLFLFFPLTAPRAQDAREVEQEKVTNSKLKGPHPLIELMNVRKSTLRRELMGVHPRVYLTEAELTDLRQRARTTHREMWEQALHNVRALTNEPPPAPAQKRRQQNEVGIAIAEAAFAYKIEGDKKYLNAARKFMDAAVSYEIWGYASNKPNVDLAAGHLLYGLGWGYDLLYHDLNETERARYREKLIKQARLVADYFKPTTGRTYAYSQNHTFIPLAGLGVAAYALYDETPEAAGWAKLTRAIFDRVLETYSQDGYYYEGFEYWIFSTPWLIHYLDAHAHATGEDLYDQKGFQHMHEYVAHSMLPSGQYVFDFGDIFEGPLTRAGKGDEYKRTHPGGRFHTNYNLLYRLAQRFKSGAAQGVAQWLKNFDQVNAEDFWSLVWYDPTVKPVPIQNQQTWMHFVDHDVFYWRSDWTKTATAFAFKCGPPEGHHTFEFLKKFPDWRLSSGHAHPDANSFIIYAAQQYLTGDTGYAGVPMTEHHNTVLINGKGQAKEGKGHDVFTDVSYERLNQLRILDIDVKSDAVVVRGDATSAYEPVLGVRRFIREFQYRVGQDFIVTDDVETAEPAVITSVLHADDRLVSEGRSKSEGPLQHRSPKRFRITVGDARLAIEPLEPVDTTTTIASNNVTAPGPPGAVNKGEQQERGVKLLISTSHPVKKTRFVMFLKLEADRVQIKN